MYIRIKTELEFGDRLWWFFAVRREYPISNESIHEMVSYTLNNVMGNTVAGLEPELWMDDEDLGKVIQIVVDSLRVCGIGLYVSDPSIANQFDIIEIEF